LDQQTIKKDFMKKIIFSCIVLIGSFQLTAQNQDTILIQLYGIGGGYGEIPDGSSLSFSMGESITSTESNFNQTLTQGFQQNSFEAVVSVLEIADIRFDVQVFPNPTSDFLNIKLSSSQDIVINEYEVQLFDISGKQISLDQNYLENSTVQMDLSPIATGAYVARLVNTKTSNIISTFKVSKATTH